MIDAANQKPRSLFGRIFTTQSGLHFAGKCSRSLFGRIFATQSGSRFAGKCSGGSKGSSLIEMMTVLVIISILAAVAAPYARRTIQREKEFALKDTLRTVRRAIDAFHADWERSRTGGGAAKSASPDGFPLNLKILVEGVETGSANDKKKRYLRALPRNPVVSAAIRFEDQWIIVGYQDDPNNRSARGKDVYDIRAKTEETALDGTRYADW